MGYQLILTHTHTHTYIYIYIYIKKLFYSFTSVFNKNKLNIYSLWSSVLYIIRWKKRRIVYHRLSSATKLTTLNRRVKSRCFRSTNERVFRLSLRKIVARRICEELKFSFNGNIANPLFSSRIRERIRMEFLHSYSSCLVVASFTFTFMSPLRNLVSNCLPRRMAIRIAACYDSI